jgi:glucose-1-phosphate cytidylyltransferase
MKVVILAGGLGTRIAEETHVKPKPMIEIGGRPLIWHIMQIYGHRGFDDFIVCLGYLGSVIKSYFLNFQMQNSDVECDLRSGAVRFANNRSPSWRVALVDTGDSTMTGGRIKRVAERLRDGTFMLTYGDGVADVDIKELIAFHRGHGRLATVTAVRPPGRFGVLGIGGAGRVQEFREKPDDEVGWINGGFFVLEPGILDYIDGDTTSWEQEPLRRLAADGQLMAFEHHGFWQAVDTVHDKRSLETLWESGAAPWRLWE